MRIGLCHEGHTPDGVTHHQRYHEMITEAVFAEEAGFDFYGLSEQHFLPDVATTSAPEGLLNVVASRTERMRFRFMSAVISVNHPIRIIERLNTLDVISDGRAELGLARSNNPNTLSAFGISPKTTRARLQEGLGIIFSAFNDGVFKGTGDVWDIPERPVVPAHVQQPHPPVFLSATSNDTHRFGADNGLGVMSGSTVLGWDYLQNNVDTYKSRIADAVPIGKAVNDSIATFVATCHCAPTMEQAMGPAEPVAKMFMDVVMGMYTKLAKQVAPTTSTWAGSPPSKSTCTTSRGSWRTTPISTSGLPSTSWNGSRDWSPSASMS